MTWKLGASSAAILIFFAASTQAADVFVEETVIAPPPAPVATWDGFFAGVHGGYGWGNATTSRNTVGFLGPFSPGYAIESSMDDWLGGVQIGYNFQRNDFVFGIIGDISATNMTGAGTSPYAGLSNVGWETDYNYIATIRGRAGWLWNDNTLFYAHGGVAFLDWDTTFTSIASLNGQSIGSTETGWVVGAGIETNVTDRISLFAEYSYMDFGNGGDSISSTVIPALTWTTNLDPINVVKVGVNFKFGQP